MGATTSKAPADVAREAFGVLNGRDADAMRRFWAPDVVEVFPYGTVRGQDAVRDAFAETFAALPDFHIEAEHVVAEGEVVLVKWRLTGTFSGARWQGIDPTGSRVELHGMDCFTIRDGLVVHNHVVFDQLEFARQIGMLPVQGTRADRATTAAFNARTRLVRRLRRG